MASDGANSCIDKCRRQLFIRTRLQGTKRRKGIWLGHILRANGQVTRVFLRTVKGERMRGRRTLKCAWIAYNVWCRTKRLRLKTSINTNEDGVGAWDLQHSRIPYSDYDVLY